MSIKTLLKVAAISSIRADYDLLSGVYAGLCDRADVEFGIVISGAHLSKSFGYTVKQIEDDGLPIIGRVLSLIDSDSARPKTAAVFMHSFIDLMVEFRPDVVILAGDREDVMAAAMACLYLKIPTVHFFGGDHASDGHPDNPIRHAISKLATFHFVSHPIHVERLRHIGESKDRIHLIGSPALDKYRNEPFLSKHQLFADIRCDKLATDSEYAVLVLHPNHGEEPVGSSEVRTILNVLIESNIPTFVSSPNTDAGYKDILEIYSLYQESGLLNFYQNLPRNTFVNLLRNAKFLIGNSSLGIVEAASIPLPVINIGTRQKSRTAPGNVVFVQANKKAIQEAINLITSSDFQTLNEKVINPYGNGDSVNSAIQHLIELDSQNMLLKKEDPLVQYEIFE